MLNIPGALENLDQLREKNPERITQTYQKLFGTPEGELVLIDLMDHYFEAGTQAVIIYIKNRILGVTEPTQSNQETIHE